MPKTTAPAPEKPQTKAAPAVELHPELVAAVAAKLAESGAMPTPDTETEKFKAIAKEVALAVTQESRTDAGVFRRSRQPVEPTYPFNPANYNLIREAEKLAEQRGHTLGAWENVPPDTTRKPMLPTTNAWHSRCIRCGVYATARWMKAPMNDTRADRDDPETGEDAMFPALGGLALTKHERLILNREDKSKGRFSGIAARSEMSALRE